MTDTEYPELRGERLDLLRRLGFGKLEHDSHVPFISHLVGTRRLLVDWGERPALCDGGLFHSAYGTEYFEVAEPAERDEVIAVIGEDAEEVAWLWCTIERDTLDPVALTVVDRRDGSVIQLGADRAADIATLWAADTVEQIERMAPHERGFAGSLPGVITLASAPARAAVDAIAPLLPSP